ncbi:MAG TPA: hypothetical protein VFL04_08660 [Rectinemataceae bacterium]|nr:hypothetical protein [Rectinemataceae bacterium]
MRSLEKIGTIAIAAFGLLVLPLPAQVRDALPNAGPAGQETSSEAPEAVFAPFPSHLRAATKAGTIVLTWTDSSDVKGRYAVYRSSRAITVETFGTATRIGEVGPGIERYEDSPPDDSAYYYLILALAEDGSPYRIFIPARNETLSPIAIEKTAVSPAAPPAPAPAPAPSLAVDGIDAQVHGDAIIVSYRPSNAGMRLVLYRGTAPMTTGRDLLEASLVAAFDDKEGSFADYPVPGVDYWYAVLAEDELKAGRVELAAGHNSTSKATRIAAALSQGDFIEPSPTRTPPLPSILLEKSAGTGSSALPRGGDAPQLGSLSPEAEKSVAALMRLAPPVREVLPRVRILKEEQSSPTGGEDYALSLIVREKLGRQDWSGAADQLRKYLSLNRSPAAAARAHFYLGEALAESGSYREAFFELISARAGLMVETKPWIDYILAILRQG